MYSRSVLRSMMLMISFLVGVLVGVICAVGGKTEGLPFAAAVHRHRRGLLHELLRRRRHVALAHPGRARRRPARRPRPRLGLVPRGRPGRPADHHGVHRDQRPDLVLAMGAGGRAGLGHRLRRAARADRRRLGRTAPRRRRPQPRARFSKTHLALIVIPVVTLFPAAALLVAGSSGHSLALRWLAVPAGLAWAAWLCRYSVLRAQRRLQTQGPEIFARLRTPSPWPPFIEPGGVASSRLTTPVGRRHFPGRRNIVDAREKAPQAGALVIFGITGDLAKKQTFRALYRLEARNRLAKRSSPSPGRTGRRSS